MVVELVEVDPEDSIGTKEQLGEFAVNCCPLPGYLIGPTRFRSLKANQLLKELDEVVKLGIKSVALFPKIEV